MHRLRRAVYGSWLPVQIKGGEGRFSALCLNVCENEDLLRLFALLVTFRGCSNASSRKALQKG